MEEVLFQRCLVLLKQPSLINSDLLFSLAAKKPKVDRSGCGGIDIATAKTVRTFLIAETIAITASSFFLLPTSIGLLLYDIEMPKMDGYALMRKIRQILDDGPAGRFRRSLFPPMLDKLTSNRRSPLAFWGHLAKPARPAEIMNIVARFCGPNGKTSA